MLTRQFIKNRLFIYRSLKLNKMSTENNIDEVVVNKEAAKEQTETIMSKKERKKLYAASKKEILKAKREEYQTNKQVGYSNKEELKDTEYYFEGGLRKVKVSF
jgi:hypothetical protein